MNTKIALEAQDLCIDYKNLIHMSLHQSLLKKGVRQMDIIRAVNGISFQVHEGEILGIVGRNGSGKSTLLRAIAGIFQPDEGWIDTRSNRVSLMSIGIGFNPNNTGRENIIKSGLLLGCSPDYIKGKMEEIIDFSELGDFIDRPVRTYSSGMYSKLSFSITAILDADIMLVDEVLSVGDEHFRKKSYNKMQNLIRSGHTVLLVSHSTDTIREFCDRVLWIDGGRMMGIGNVNEVLAEYNAFMEK